MTEAIARTLPTIPNVGEPCPIGWLETCLGRIANSNEALRAVVALDREGCERAAIDSARRWRDGASRSPIDGAPVLVKANFAVAGLPWHAGIAAYRDRIAQDDAPAVARLRAAGAVILGLTNMDEGALGAAGNNSWLGRIGNPRDARLSAGGSSGGSAAAVAAGYCLAALGSDTIGSIAIPAAYCGVVGHRASPTVLPLVGVVPLSQAFDHLGWHARSTTDAAAIGAALGSPAYQSGRMRIAALALDGIHVAAAVADAVDSGIDAARRDGWQVDRFTSPIILSNVARRMFEVAEADAAIVHRQMMTDRPDGFSPPFRRLLDWGAHSGPRRRDDNVAALGEIAAAIRTALTGYDALLMPAVPHTGFAAGSPPPGDQALFAALPACLGWPATTVPMGSDGRALLVTAPSDGVCLTIAHRITARLA